MHARCTGDKQSSIDKHYQTVVSDDVKNMPQKGKKGHFCMLGLIEKICVKNTVIIYTHNYKSVLFVQFVMNGQLKFWIREEEPVALIFSIIV